MMPNFSNLTPSLTSYEYSSDMKVSDEGSKLIFCEDFIEKKFSMVNSAIMFVEFIYNTMQIYKQNPIKTNYKSYFRRKITVLFYKMCIYTFYNNKMNQRKMVILHKSFDL